MDEEHEKAIQRNFTSLVERTDLDSMVTVLYEKGVFSEQMIERYQNPNKSSRDRKRQLYRDITRRGPRAFGHLVDSLSELGHWDIVRELDPNSPFATFPKPSSSSMPKRETNPQSSKDSQYVSLSNEKNKTKEMQKSAVPVAATAPVDLDNAAAKMPVIPEFKVIKSTRFMDHDGKSDLELYHTRSRDRGVLMVLSYINFQNNIEQIRAGVDVDCATLKHLFLEIGFEVISYPDLTKEQTLNTLSSLEVVLEKAECVFLVVSSHGYERYGTSDIDIRCSDGQLISFLEIMTYFSNKSLPKLIGIPKVLIFQTCRGSNEEYVLSSEPTVSQLLMPGGGVQRDGSARARGPPPPPPRPSAAPRLLETPLYSDILIAHSTLPGQVSYRDGGCGSWYIQVLCEVFAERVHNTHVDKLFTLVDMRMREKFRRQTSSVERWGFNKRLYLHPGLYE
ncbi:unnamed protein product [Arctia plantaginis]|uniref:Uncharacterized protein n=1 Tax=Arctia plantaginis TaxID=874455 RepID=A0A8S0ZQ18_ARCPL|nr:unnamed protein product [Arctia plantaginis]